MIISMDAKVFDKIKYPFMVKQLSTKVMKVLATTFKQEKEIKGIQIRKEEEKLIFQMT